MDLGSNELLVIQGGRPLRGEVRVSGAKNSALKLIAASLLTDEEITLHNVPRISDVDIMLQLAQELGVAVEWSADGTLHLNACCLRDFQASYDLVSRMRASVVVIGPLVARLGRARVAMPGGCQIGSRKIDLHIHGLEQLGADISVAEGCIEAKASRLRGARIKLAFPSVGATENLLMAASLAEGQTVIENVAREPEIIDLVGFLVAMGAKIRGAGTSNLIIDGVSSLHGCDYSVIPDRIEAGTLMMMVAASGGDVLIRGARAADLELVIEKLSQVGVDVQLEADGIRIARSGELSSVRLATLPYPGFPTDLQAPAMAVLSGAKGASVLTENVFESRFAYVDELRKLGSDVQVSGHHAVIEGPVKLRGATVTATDLRAGAGLTVAALAAEGTSYIRGVHHIYRGYESFVSKLQGIGAAIESRPQ